MVQEKENTNDDVMFQKCKIVNAMWESMQEIPYHTPNSSVNDGYSMNKMSIFGGFGLCCQR